MKLVGKVIRLESETSFSDKDYVVATITLYGDGELKLRMRKHEARGYRLGRMVDAQASLRKE